MSQLNNLDVIILIVVAISALIALSRGLIKEVLSIVGWVLGCAAIIYLLPFLSPIAGVYIKSPTMAGIAASLFILIVFLIVWILLTGNLVGKVRNSKLGSIDRLLGLFFGILRAFLLVILVYILISWIQPKDKWSATFKESKYFNIAGEFARPIENLIPADTLEAIRNKTKDFDKSAGEKDDEEEPVAVIESPEKSETDELFEKLARPQVEKAKKKTQAKIKEEFKGYNQSERNNLDRLIENVE